ncbi:MAG: GNAT family N-acetyltransferase [Elsteraceae bacterium]
MTTTEVPPVLLETARLRLRRFTRADAENLVDLDSDPEVVRYAGGWRRSNGVAPSLDWVRAERMPLILGHYLNNGPLALWAAETRQDSRFLGWFALHPRYRPGLCEIGWRFHRRDWGQGFATEGAQALIDKAFRDLGVDRVVATALAANAASINVMKKCGMSFVKPYDHPPYGPAVEYVRDR